MATDEVLTSLCQKGNRIPTLRLYSWSPPAVSIGYFQKIDSTVNVNKCKKFGVDVVRRLTGGRAVLHQDELTYSVCASVENFPELGNSVNQTYQEISLAFLEVLKVLGVKGEWVKSTPRQKKEKSCEPCFVSSSKYEINISSKKLIGSAQRRFGKVFLQHGSIPLKASIKSLACFLPQKEDADKIEKLLHQQSSNIQELSNQKIELEDMVKAVKYGLKEYFKIEFVEQDLSDEELDRIEKLAQDRYSKNWWNFFR